MIIADVIRRPADKPTGAGATAIQTVLVTLSGYPADACLLKEAAEITRQLGALLTVLHVHVDPRSVAMSLSASDPMGTAAMSGLIDEFVKDADERQAAAKRTFDTVCCEAGLPTDRQLPPGQPSAVWLALSGKETERLASFGRCADLVVLLRPGGSEETPLDLSEAALFGCGRPTLLVPPGVHAGTGGTVVVAWKSTAECARAITGAIPFIQRAQKVVVLTAAEGNEPPDASAERLVTALQRHNPSTFLQHLPGDGRRPVDVLLEAAMQRGASLLVMGGYSHSRAREALFGGFTRSVLRTASLPVLMAH